MKFGPRKPNFKKRIKARTTGKLKRKMKKAVNPLYKKKGMGYIKNYKSAIKNKIYHKTTFDPIKSIKNYLELNRLLKIKDVNYDVFYFFERM